MTGTVTVRTALGVRSVDPDDGYTLPHEHVLCDVRARWHGSSPIDHPEVAGRRVGPATIAEVRDDPQGSVPENLVLSDSDLATEELKHAVDTGCQLVAELTTEGLHPRPAATVRAATAAGVQIVLGIGRYIAASLNPRQQSESVDQLVYRWIDQFTDGIDGYTIGVLGELGVSAEFPTAEKRTLEAAAIVAADTGLPVVVHTEPGLPSLDGALDILERRGVDPTRVTVAHLDWHIDAWVVADVMRRGYTASFDLFGRSLFRGNSAGYADTDHARIQAIVGLADRGLLGNIVLSQDICMRHCLAEYGGYGYAHLAEAVFPELGRLLGADATHQLTRVNPLRSLRV